MEDSFHLAGVFLWTRTFFSTGKIYTLPGTASMGYVSMPEQRERWFQNGFYWFTGKKSCSLAN